MAKFTYQPLLDYFNENNLSMEKELVQKLGLSSSTVSKLRKNKILQIDVLTKIADHLDVDIEDIVKLNR